MTSFQAQSWCIASIPMEIALFTGHSFSLGLFWLWFYLRLNKIRPSPKRWVGVTFLLGMLLSVPAYLINEAFLPDEMLSGTLPMSTIAISMLLVVGHLRKPVNYSPYDLVPTDSATSPSL